MLKRVTFLVGGIVLSLVTMNTLLFSQAPPVAPPTGQPAELSLDGLMTPTEPLDMNMFKLPEKATAAELLKFIEGLEGKVPQPKNEVEMRQLVGAMSNVFGEVADRILKMPEATDKEKEDAAQLKVVSLTAKTGMDPKDTSAQEELSTFLATLLKEAKTTEQKVNAWQLKLQSLVGGAQNDPSVLDKVDALADDVLKAPEEELQILGLEVKAQVSMAKGRSDAAGLDPFVEMLGKYIDDAARPEKVRNKAMELKFIGLLMASEKDPARKAAVDKYFEEQLRKISSIETKKNFYQLRLQSLIDPKKADPESLKKAFVVVDLLLKEENEELRSLGLAVKASLITKQAQEDPSKIDELFSFADTILANEPTKEQKEQALGMKIQGYVLKSKKDPKALDELLLFVDKTLTEKPDAKILNHLANIKVQILMNRVTEDPARLPELEKAIDEFSKVPELKQMVDSTRPLLYMIRISSVAEKKGSIEELNTILADVKKLMTEDPSATALILESEAPIVQIGKQNNDSDLWKKTLTDFAAFCDASSNEDLKEQGQLFKGLLKLSSLVGQTLPFEGVLVGSEDGKSFAAADLAGKVYLIDLWSTSNPSYFETIEEQKTLYDGYRAKNFEIVGINLDENTQMLQRAIQVFGMSWPIISHKQSTDAGKTLPDVMNPASSGMKVLVGKDGKVLLVTKDLAEVKVMLLKIFGEPEKKADPKESAPAPAEAASTPAK